MSLNKLFQDRINVIHGDIQDQADLLRKADVIVLNNVFEFFVDSDLQVKIWHLLKLMLKKGCQIVSLPPLNQALANINVSWPFLLQFFLFFISNM